MVTVTHLGTVGTFVSTSGTAVSSMTVDFTSTVAVGTLLVLTAGSARNSGIDTSITDLSDSVDNPWQVIGSQGSGTTAQLSLAACVTTSPLTTSHSLTANFAAGSPRRIGTIEAFSVSDGSFTTPAAPASLFASDTGSSSSTYSGGTTSSVTAPAFAFCAVAAAGNGTDWSSLTGGWTMGTRVQTTSPTSAYRWCRAAWRPVTTNEAVAASGSFTASTSSAGGVFVVALSESTPSAVELAGTSAGVAQVESKPAAGLPSGIDFALAVRASSYSGSGNWLDLSGNENHATPQGSPTFSDGEWTLNGTSQYFTVADDPTLNFDDDESLTIVMVGDPIVEASPTHFRFVDKTKLTETGYGYFQSFTVATTLSSRIRDTGVNERAVSLTGLQSGLGTFVCRLNRDTQVLETGINGVYNDNPNAATVGSLINDAVLYIGARERSTGAVNEFFPGRVIGVVLARQALTDSEVVQVRDWITNSTTELAGTLGGGTTVTAGELEVVTSLAGTSSGVGAVSGELAVIAFAELAGTTAGQATTSGSLTVIEVAELAGQSDGTSTAEMHVDQEGPVLTDLAPDGFAHVLHPHNLTGTATDIHGVAEITVAVSRGSGGWWDFDLEAWVGGYPGGHPVTLDNPGADVTTFSILVNLPEAEPSDLTAEWEAFDGYGNLNDEGMTRFYLDQAIESTVAGTSSVTGALEVEPGLRATASGVGSVSGTLTQVGDFGGMSEGDATLAGTLQLGYQLQSSSAGVGSITGDLSVEAEIEGSTSGDSTVSGSLDVVTSLEGTTSGASQVTGNIVTVTQLAGTTAGEASVSGSLQVTTVMAGQSDGDSTVTGQLQQVHELSGSISGDSTVTSALQVIDVDEFNGESDGVATVSATLQQAQQFTGSSDGEATVSGDLELGLQLEGSSAGEGSATGNLQLGYQLEGSTSGQGSVTGDLDQIIEVEGSASGEATVSGTLEEITTSLAGSVSGTATVIGSLSQIQELAGSSAGESTVTGELLLVGQVNLEAESDGTATVAGVLDVIAALDGSTVGSAIVSGSFDITTGMGGSSTGDSTVSGILTLVYQLEGGAAGATTITADLTVPATRGFLDISTSLVGGLSTSTQVVGSATTSTATVGTLTSETS